MTPVTTIPLKDFTETLFTHGGLPIRRAVLDFDDTAAERFALDNLTFEGTPIPEPSSLILVGIGAVGLSFLRWRQKTTVAAREPACLTPKATA
jgi:hypothetical protein